MAPCHHSPGLGGGGETQRMAEGEAGVDPTPHWSLALLWPQGFIYMMDVSTSDTVSVVTVSMAFRGPSPPCSCLPEDTEGKQSYHETM